MSEIILKNSDELLVRLRLRGQILRYAPEPLAESCKKFSDGLSSALKGVVK